MPTKEEKWFLCPHCREEHQSLRYECEKSVVGDYNILTDEYDEDEDTGADTRFYCPDCEKEISEDDILAFQKSIN